jgi:hypothetical protein
VITEIYRHKEKKKIEKPFYLSMQLECFRWHFFQGAKKPAQSAKSAKSSAKCWANRFAHFGQTNFNFQQNDISLHC